MALSAFWYHMAFGAPSPQGQQFSASELESVCAVLADPMAMRITGAPDKAAWEASASDRKAPEWRNLPERIVCGGKERLLRDPSRIVRSVAFGQNETFMALQGGYQVGPVDGELNYCFFQLADGVWRKIGCQTMAIS